MTSSYQESAISLLNSAQNSLQLYYLLLTLILVKIDPIRQFNQVESLQLAQLNFVKIFLSWRSRLMKIQRISFYSLNLGGYQANGGIGIALGKLFFLILPVFPLLLPIILIFPQLSKRGFLSSYSKSKSSIPHISSVNSSFPVPSLSILSKSGLKSSRLLPLLLKLTQSSLHLSLILENSLLMNLICDN